MRLKPIVSYTHILIAILILAGLTGCGREKQEPGLTGASSSPAKQTRLAGKVSDALKDNIFLKPQGLEVVVIDEKDGFVKLSVTKGSRRLRKFLAAGTDLDSGLGAAEMVDSDGQQGWTALKKTVDYIKTIDGVKAVLVTAETNTKSDQIDDMMRRKAQLEGLLHNGEPADINNVFELLQIYNALHEQGPMARLLGDILCSNLPSEIYLQLAQMLVQMQCFDHAIQTLETAVEKGGEPTRAALRKDSRFQALYNDVRFQALFPPIPAKKGAQ